MRPTFQNFKKNEYILLIGNVLFENEIEGYLPNTKKIKENNQNDTQINCPLGTYFCSYLCDKLSANLQFTLFLRFLSVSVIST